MKFAKLTVKTFQRKKTYKKNSHKQITQGLIRG